MNSELVQTRFDYGLLDEETRIFVKVKAQAIHARLKRTAEDIIEIGKDLIAVQGKLRGDNEGQGYRGENQGNGQFLAWIKTEFEMSHMSAYRFMSVAEKFGDGEKFNTVLNFSPKVLYELSTASDEVVAKVESGEMEAKAEEKQITLLEAIQLEKRAERAEKKAKEEEEARQKLQRSFDLFKEDRDKERQGLNSKIQDIENEKVAKENEILGYKQKQEALQEHLQTEAKQQLEKDLEKQRREQKSELKRLEKELKEQYQFKAENTIHSLLSHGIKSMAETQLTIEHTVSAGMLQAVQQLGGKQVNSFLAQAESLQEELDSVIAKLTHGDYLALQERVGTND